MILYEESMHGLIAMGDGSPMATNNHGYIRRPDVSDYCGIF
jgi:hypothetical protein